MEALDNRLTDRFAALGGAIDSRSAFISSVSRKEFEECEQLLSEMQYGISSLSTIISDGETKYSACWRASLSTELLFGLTKSTLLKSIESKRQEGDRLIDLGGYLTPEKTEEFWGIWSQSKNRPPNQIVRVALNQNEVRKSFEELRKDHIPVLRRAFFDADDRIKYCEIWQTLNESDDRKWMLFTCPPEQMRNKFHASQHLACQSIDLAQGSKGIKRFSSAIWHTPNDLLETKVIQGVPQDVLVEAGKHLMSLGFQPKCISNSIGDRKKQQCSAVWTRTVKGNISYEAH